jgi:B12-binding domain/radical SAM domain protein
MTKTTVVFRWLRHNHYTVAVLLGLLDQALDGRRFELGLAGSRRDLLSRLKERGGPAVVAYSFTTSEALQVEREIRSLRIDAPRQITILCGGPHPSACPDEVLSWGADLVFVGEAEESLPAFLREFAETRRLPASPIVQPLPLGDFDSYPPFWAEGGLFAPIEIRRGCRNRCAFCQTPRLFPTVRERTPAGILHHAGSLQRAGLKRVLFTASDALLYGSTDGRTANLDALEAFLSGLGRTGLAISFGFFPSEVAPHTLARTPEAAQVLRRHVSNRELVIGAQSGSPSTLERLGRPHTVEEIEAAAAAARAAGFVPLVDILLGTPGEGREERRVTLDWMGRLRLREGARFNLHHFLPLPGTPFAGQPAERLEPDVLEAIRRLLDTGAARGNFFAPMKAGSAPCAEPADS